MREEEIKDKKSRRLKILESLKKKGDELAKIGEEVEEEREMKYISRLLYAGEVIESAGLLFTFNEKSLLKVLMDNRAKIQKPLI